MTMTRSRDKCSEQSACECFLCREAMRLASDDADSVLRAIDVEQVAPGTEWTVTHACLMRLKRVWQLGTVPA
jgi:hypothetical protein